MKAIVFDAHKFERPYFKELNERFGHQLTFLEGRLTRENVRSAMGFPAVCAFAHDCLDEPVLKALHECGVRLIALRAAGFNNVDLKAAKHFGIKVVRVPAYSPHSVAEHAVAMLLALNRKICRASARVHELNFSLDGLVGFDLYGKTVGVIGAGRIGAAFAKIMLGFGCRVLINDPNENAQLRSAGAEYASREKIFHESDVISLHLPLTADSRHLINETAFQRMKMGVILINTGRGALVDAKALIASLKSGKIGGACLDVYEEEESVFFQDFSSGVLQDDVLARLLTFQNVLITAHQAFLTREALHNIVQTTLQNLHEFEMGNRLVNEVKA